MLAVKIHKGRSSPVLLCDECNQTIDDGEMAMYLWEYLPIGVDGYQTIYTIHKRACDKAFQVKHPWAKSGPWMPMQGLPIYLLKNMGLDYEKSLANAVALSDITSGDEGDNI